MLFPVTARGGRCISLLPPLKRAQEFESGMVVCSALEEK
jgi:hypothetical protein